MVQKACVPVVRKRGVDPLTNTNVSKSPEHIAFAESTLSSVVGTPLTVRILFLPQKKFLAIHRRVRNFFFRGKACQIEQCQPSSLNFNYRPTDEEHVFAFKPVATHFSKVRKSRKSPQIPKICTGISGSDFSRRRKCYN